LEDQGVDVRINRMGGLVLDLSTLEQGQVLGCCVHGNEPLCSVKCGEFLDQLRNS